MSIHLLDVILSSSFSRWFTHWQV